MRIEYNSAAVKLAKGSDQSVVARIPDAAWQWPWNAGDPLADSMSFATFQGLMDAADDGSEIDLGTQGVVYQDGDASLDVGSKSLTIRGGHFTGAREGSWTETAEGSGIFWSSVNGSMSGDVFRRVLIDPSQSQIPTLACWPPLPDDMINEQFARNDNWFIIRSASPVVDNGDVLTTTGTNSNGGKITGFIIDDTAAQTAVNDIMSSGASAVVYLWAGANRIKSTKVTGWDNSTKQLDVEETQEFYGYCHWVISSSDLIQAGSGDYAWSPADSRVYYAPINGDPSKARIPECVEMFYNSSGGSLNFVNTEFSGTFGTNQGNGFFVKQNFANLCNVTLDTCYVHDAFNGVQGVTSATSSLFDRMVTYGVTVFDGAQISDCHFQYFSESSAILCSPFATSEYVSVPLSEVVVDGCVFYLPNCLHGGAVTLYENGWQNATVRNNVFVDVSRSIQWQHSNGDERETPGVLTITNNLAIIGKTPGTVDASQNGIAANRTDVDAHLLPVESQEVVISWNTFVIEDELFSTSLGFRPGTVSLYNHITSDMKVYCNALSGVAPPTGPPPPSGTNQPSKHYKNLLYNKSKPSGSGYGATDIADADFSTSPVDQDYFFDWDTLSLTGTAATAAPDGGTIGCRLRPGLTLAQCRNSYVWQMPAIGAASFPTISDGSLSNVYANEDNR